MEMDKHRWTNMGQQSTQFALSEQQISTVAQQRSAINTAQTTPNIIRLNRINGCHQNTMNPQRSIPNTMPYNGYNQNINKHFKI